ncbi:MAG TPA: hypothetical protein DHV62_02325 [Elusimicrobia bacterium]|nr:hypothetical protein [Elusimicrobiota bacterium]
MIFSPLTLILFLRGERAKGEGQRMGGWKMEKCPKCGSKLEKVQSCCTVIWFCKKCNEVIDRFQPKFVEIYQSPKRKVQK